MIATPQFAGQKVAVFGLGASGLSAARALQRGGATVIAWDDGDEGRQAARQAGFQVEDLCARDWTDIAALVLAPGVPLTHPKPHRVVQLARLAATPILGDVELFARVLADTPADRRPKVIAITGSNGKSTTTALIGHLARKCGRDVQVGGNIGKPVLDLDGFHAGCVYVLELSSFQLDLTETLAPDVSVLLNITPDHLDRHGDLAGYAAAKKRIFQAQSAAQRAVVCVDTEQAATMAMGLKVRSDGPKPILTSAVRVLPDGVHAVGGRLYDAMDARPRQVADLRGIGTLTGRHNWQNAACAYGACRAIGLDASRLVDGLASFAGLAHRMQPVATIDGVKFVNDSKATNTDAARQALMAFDNIYWIAGGRAKQGGFAELRAAMSGVTHAYLIGEAAEAMAAQLSGAVRVQICRDLDAAVVAAARDVIASDKPDPVVLFSPACASFDQFANFVARGEAFCALVNNLAGGGAPAAATTPNAGGSGTPDTGNTPDTGKTAGTGKKAGGPARQKTISAADGAAGS